MKINQKEIIVSHSDSDQRIESYLRSVIPTVSRARWRTEIESGRVRVNDRVVRVGEFIRAGDRVVYEEVGFLVPGKRASLVSDIKLPPIVYEDEAFFVFNKPRKMHSVLQRETDSLTLADCAVIYLPSALEASPNVLDGGLVQRLDYYTDGLCIVAKYRDVWEDLHRQLTSHQVLKTYLAKVSNLVSNEILSRAVCENVFDSARVLRREGEVAVVEVSLRDGSRHVVRKRFKSIGFPLLGDVEYGCELFKDTGFFLTCTQVSLSHPKTRELIRLDLSTVDSS